MSLPKIAFVLIDGIADVACGILGGKTTLQQATIPTLDAMAGRDRPRSCNF
jgi:2,3-bisphosphoglycerate-independent phosphoglycerate mutase